MLSLRFNYLLAALLLVTGLLSGQRTSPNPYHFSLKRDLTYVGAGALLTAAGAYQQSRVPEVSLSDLRLTDYDRVNMLDRSWGRYTPRGQARKWSDRLLNYSAAAPALLALGKHTRRDLHKVALLYVETMTLAGGLTSLTKTTFLRTRPYVFSPAWDENKPLESGDRASMISGHTSMSAAGAFFFARVFSDYYPDSKLKPYVWGVAATLPALTGYLRIRAAKHFPSDVVAGYLVGASIGYLVPTLHKRQILPRGMALSGGPGGVLLGYTF